MALNAGEVEVLLKLRDQLTVEMTAAKGRFVGSSIQMTERTITLQSKLLLLESALKQVTAEETALASSIVKAGSSEQVQIVALEALAKKHLELEKAVQGTRERLTLFSDATKATHERVSGAGSGVDAFTGSLRNFDNTLSSVGINIGPQIKAIGEIGSAAGKTATQLGLVGTAGLALGAGIGGWKIGRAIAEFLDLDKALASSAERLRFLATEGAKQDVIARAIENGAKATITYTEAIKFNNDEVRRAAAAQVDWNAKLADAKTELAKLTQVEIDQISIAKQLGVSTEDLKLQFKLSDDALRLFDSEVRTSSEVVGKNADQMAKLEKQLAAAAKQRESARASTSGHSSATRDDTEAVKANAIALQQQAAALAAEFAAREASLKQIAEAEAKRKADNDAFMNATTLNDRNAGSITSDVPALTGFALDNVISRFRQAGDQTDDQALQRALAALEAQEGRKRPTDNASFFQLQSDRLLLAQLREMFFGAPRFAEGVTNFSGGLARVHKDELLVNLPPGTDVIPGGGGGRAAVVNNLTFHVNGTAVDVARQVKKIILQDLKSSYQF